MPIETPILRVSRPVAACSRCRSAKTKCDGKLPACTACEKAGKTSECSSINDEFAKGKERSYVATLESRIEKLEKRLADSKRTKLTGHGATINGQTSQPLKDLRPAQKKEASDMDEVVSSFGLLSVNAAARDFHGFTSTMSYARLIMAAAVKEPMPSRIARGLPEKAEAQTLLRYYFDNIFLYLPFFEETSFYISFEAVYRPTGQVATNLDHWLVLMVLSISCISRSEQFNDKSYLDGVAYAASALRYQESVLRPGSVSSIQAMMFLIEYSLYDPAHFDIWTLLGAISRAMVDLGMHQDPPRSSSMSKAKIEIRQRVYHCIYACDRYSSMAQERAFSFNDVSTNVALPAVSSRSQPPGKEPQPQLWGPNQDCWIGMVRLRQVQSSWYTRIYQSGLPVPAAPYDYIWQTFHETDEVGRNFGVLTAPIRLLNQLEVLYSQIFLLAPSPWLSDICELAQILIFEYSIDFANLTLVALANPTSRIWLTCGTARRVQQVGKFFIKNLSNHQDFLLSGKTPRIDMPSDPQSPLPPRYPFQNRQKNLERAAHCISQLLEVFRILGSRFGVEAWQRQFEHESRHILDVLT